jgi:hypothetical protein
MAARIDEVHVLLLVIRDVHHVRFPSAWHVKPRRCVVDQQARLIRKLIPNARTFSQPTLCLQVILSMLINMNHPYAVDYSTPTDERSNPPCTVEVPSLLMLQVGLYMSTSSLPGSC